MNKSTFAFLAAPCFLFCFDYLYFVCFHFSSSSSSSSSFNSILDFFSLGIYSILLNRSNRRRGCTFFFCFYSFSSSSLLLLLLLPLLLTSFSSFPISPKWNQETRKGKKEGKKKKRKGEKAKKETPVRKHGKLILRVTTTKKLSIYILCTGFRPNNLIPLPNTTRAHSYSAALAFLTSGSAFSTLSCS